MIKLNSKIFWIFLLLFTAQMSYATGKVQTNPYLDWAMENIIFLLAGALILGAGISIWNYVESMFLLRRNELYKQANLPIPVKPKATPFEDRLKNIYQKAWALIPMDDEKDIQLDHDYDGIHELDNSLPPWWLYTFYLTILFGIGYLYVYHYSGIGKSSQESYYAEMEIAEKQKRIFLERQANSVNENNVIALLGEDDLKNGKSIYIANCAACHGQFGEGGVGPNLTDKYWMHGGGIKNVFKTIKYGVPEKGMIAWQSQMQPKTMQQIASYILSLENTNPPNAKEAQGELFVTNTKLSMNTSE